jgi:hypothetical protein
MNPRAPLVLAVSASPRGFAFVLFAGPTTPFDWGVKEFRGPHKSALTLLALKKLLRQYRPERLVIEETGKGSRRGPRIRALYRDLVALAGREQVPVMRFTKAEVRAAFAPENARTRPEIAKAVAARLPVFTPKLPPFRKIWMSEDPRQSLFDAAGLGCAWYAGCR